MVGAKAGSPPSRHGLDPWATTGGTVCSTWDHWFLLLVFGGHGGGWSALHDQLREKRRGVGFEQYDAEAKLNHLDDLERRWTSLGDSSREALLRERALRGYWSRFPVSRASYERALRAVLEARDFYSERATVDLARRLDTQLAPELRRATSPAEQVAVLRAFLTSLLLAFERADDSCGILGDLARDHFPQYFTAPWRDAGLSPDLYSGTSSSMPSGRITGCSVHASWRRSSRRSQNRMLIDEMLRELRAELCTAELEYQAEEALTLLGALHVNKQSFGVFEDLARDMGSRHWERITTMAESALDAGHRELARTVFAASDQPGMHGDYLRHQCRRLLGPTPPAGQTTRAPPQDCALTSSTLMGSAVRVGYPVCLIGVSGERVGSYTKCRLTL